MPFARHLAASTPVRPRSDSGSRVRHACQLQTSVSHPSACRLLCAAENACVFTFTRVSFYYSARDFEWTPPCPHKNAGVSSLTVPRKTRAKTTESNHRSTARRGGGKNRLLELSTGNGALQAGPSAPARGLRVAACAQRVPGPCPDGHAYPPCAACVLASPRLKEKEWDQLSRLRGYKRHPRGASRGGWGRKLFIYTRVSRMSLPFPRALEEAVGMQRIGPVGSEGQDASGCASCYAYGVVCALLGASLQAVGLQVCLCGICCPCVLFFTYIPGRSRSLSCPPPSTRALRRTTSLVCLDPGV